MDRFDRYLMAEDARELAYEEGRWWMMLEEETNGYN